MLLKNVEAKRYTGDKQVRRIKSHGQRAEGKTANAPSGASKRAAQRIVNVQRGGDSGRAADATSRLLEQSAAGSLDL